MDRPPTDKLFPEKKQGHTQEEAYDRMKREIEGKKKKIELDKKEQKVSETDSRNNCKIRRNT